MIANPLIVIPNKEKKNFKNVFASIKLKAIDKTLINTERIDNTLTGIFERLKNLSPDKSEESDSYNKLSKKKTKYGKTLNLKTSIRDYTKSPRKTIDIPAFEDYSRKSFRNLVLKTSANNSPKHSIPPLPKLSTININYSKRSVFVNESKMSGSHSTRSSMKKSFSFFTPVSKSKLINVN